MKSTFLLLVICFSSLLLSMATEADVPADVLLEARTAAIQLEIKQAQDLIMFGRGAFISEEGHALLCMGSVCYQQVPTIRCADAGEVKFGDILGIFPEQGLALVKFDHRPKTWLELATEEPEVGDSISLVTLDGEAPWERELPPIVGPVMATRSELNAGLRVPQFVKVLSLGAGVTSAQVTSMTPGDFALDREGAIVGFLKGNHYRNGQLFIGVVPVVGIAEDVEKMKRAGERIPHPFDEVDNPMDTAALSDNYQKMTLAIRRGDLDSARRAYEELEKKYPSSFALKLAQFDPNIMTPDRARQLAVIENVEKPRAEGSRAARVQILGARAMFSIARGDKEGGIRDLKTAIALSPKDYSNNRESLAVIYARLGSLDEAEELCRQALVGHPESIQLNELLERVLVKRHAWDELKIVEDRLQRLYEIYRRK